MQAFADKPPAEAIAQLQQQQQYTEEEEREVEEEEEQQTLWQQQEAEEKNKEQLQLEGEEGQEFWKQLVDINQGEQTDKEAALRYFNGLPSDSRLRMSLDIDPDEHAVASMATPHEQVVTEISSVCIDLCRQCRFSRRIRQYINANVSKFSTYQPAFTVMDP